MFSTCHWHHLVQAFRTLPLFSSIGLLSSSHNTVKKIVFKTPDGRVIEIPEGSEMEVHVGQDGNLYGIGFEHAPGSYGMTHGMTPFLEEMLRVVPENNASRLFLFPEDGSPEKVIRTWVPATGVWATVDDYRRLEQE